MVATPVRAEESMPVTPLATESVPVMVDRVEVATQVGTPLDRAKVKPSVELAIDERLLAVVV